MIGKILRNFELPYIVIAGNKTTFILFKSNKPSLVIKVSKENVLKERIKIINKLQKNAWIKKTIPKLIKQGSFRNHYFYVESYLDGHKMVPDLHKLDWHLELIINWLIRLNKTWSKSIDKKTIKQIKNTIKELDSFIQLNQREKNYLKLMINKLVRMSKEIKLYISHGDFAYPNILIKNTHINVLELDEYNKNIPLFDFFNFLMTYYFYLWERKKIKKSFIKFAEKIKNKKCVRNYLKFFELEDDYYLFLSLYLIDRINFYSKIYATIPENIIKILIKSFKEISFLPLQTEKRC